jgi:hypothetical protein
MFPDNVPDMFVSDPRRDTVIMTTFSCRISQTLQAISRIASRLYYDRFFPNDDPHGMRLDTVSVVTDHVHD